ncbi:MAG: SDR family oxidoreductase [Trueperaceae bacterium]|nr:SDR family oxidoreductase [Trueperaceae bacterium]
MKTCVITGAASGIGEALARYYCQKGYQVIGIDRQSKTLKAFDSSFSLVEFDLKNTEGFTHLIKDLPETIDIFIHSAGINHVGRFETSEVSSQATVLDINFKAPVLLTQELLKQGKLAHGSSVVFIASLSHQLSYPGASVYAASKDGLTAFARSLGILLKAKGIHVLTVFPGPTRTPHASMHSPDNSREHKRMLPEHLAKLINKAIDRKQLTLVPGAVNKLFAFAGTYFPRLGERIMVKSLYQKILEKEAS